MEGRRLQANEDLHVNGDRERETFEWNLNISLTPSPPSLSLSPLPPPSPSRLLFSPTSNQEQFSLQWQPLPHASPSTMPIYLEPSSLPPSQPPPVLFSGMFPSSSPPSPQRRQLQHMLFQFCPLAARTEEAAPSAVGHRYVHGSGGGGGGYGRMCPRRSSVRQPPKEDNIPPPYPWATDKRATVHSLEYLEAHGIDKISGQVCCKRCEQVYTMEVDLKKVCEVCNFIFENLHLLHNRAPKEWLTPRMLDCDKCKQEACVKPVTDEKKKKINWLFLLATQSLGLCTLEQLKYFCKHAKSHRTGAKDRVLHDTYISLFNQLIPSMAVASRRARMPSSRS